MIYYILYMTEKFIETLISELESTCIHKEKSSHIVWKREDVDLDIKKCRKHCFIDNGYMWNSLSMCDSCDKILHSKLDRFNKSNTELIFDINIIEEKFNNLTDVVKNMNNQISNLTNNMNNMNNQIKSINEENQNLKNNINNYQTNQTNANIKIVDKYKISGIGYILKVDIITPGKIKRNNTYISKNKEIMFKIKDFEHNFCPVDFEYPATEILIAPRFLKGDIISINNYDEFEYIDKN